MGIRERRARNDDKLPVKAEGAKRPPRDGGGRGRGRGRGAPRGRGSVGAPRGGGRGGGRGGSGDRGRGSRGASRGSRGDSRGFRGGRGSSRGRGAPARRFEEPKQGLSKNLCLKLRRARELKINSECS